GLADADSWKSAAERSASSASRSGRAAPVQGYASTNSAMRGAGSPLQSIFQESAGSAEVSRNRRNSSAEALEENASNPAATSAMRSGHNLRSGAQSSIVRDFMLRVLRDAALSPSAAMPANKCAVNRERIA